MFCTCLKPLRSFSALAHASVYWLNQLYTCYSSSLSLSGPCPWCHSFSPSHTVSVSVLVVLPQVLIVIVCFFLLVVGFLCFCIIWFLYLVVYLIFKVTCLPQLHESCSDSVWKAFTDSMCGRMRHCGQSCVEPSAAITWLTVFQQWHKSMCRSSSFTSLLPPNSRSSHRLVSSAQSQADHS